MQTLRTLFPPPPTPYVLLGRYGASRAGGTKRVGTAARIHMTAAPTSLLTFLYLLFPDQNE